MWEFAISVSSSLQQLVTPMVSLLFPVRFTLWMQEYTYLNIYPPKSCADDF